MKRVSLFSALLSALLFNGITSGSLTAQTLTIPDYSYIMVNSEYGMVSQAGSASPGPAGKYSMTEMNRPYGIFMANGYRWWGYPDAPLMICADLPIFNYPGSHGIYGYPLLPCMNPPTGFMGSWGGVMTDPAGKKIICMAGTKHQNGPTVQYCIPNPYGSGQICYPVPSVWGNETTFGYLRRIVVVQSSTLQKGEPVQITTTIEASRKQTGGGTIESKGVLFLTKLNEAVWYKSSPGREFLRWGDMSDILRIASLTEKMLALLIVESNSTDSKTITASVGDTLIVEMGFYNRVMLPNPYGAGESEGWIGEKPSILFSNAAYARTDSVKSLFRKHGSIMTYDLVPVTPGVTIGTAAGQGDNIDQDLDGIGDSGEKGMDGNNDLFDGNSDGIADYKQANVASSSTFDGMNYVTLVVPEGYVISQLRMTGNPSPLDSPADAQFPFGFFDFTIDGLAPGASITITLILHTGETPGKYYKYGLTSDNLNPHWYEFMYDGTTGAEMDGNRIVLHFRDGLRGDDDITANGTLKEPGGPAKSGTTGSESIPGPGGINIYPNPAYDRIAIDFGNGDPGDKYRLMIFSNNGIKVREEEIVLSGSGIKQVVDISLLPRGIYMVTLSGRSHIYKGKFIKIR